MRRPVRVAIVGGGFTAVHAWKGMRRAAGRSELEVTVVSEDNFLVQHGMIGEMVTGRVAPGNILNPTRRILRGAKVRVAHAEAIDVAARRIETSRPLDGSTSELEYDQLVLAVGCADETETYPGLAEHAFRLKRFEDCLALRNHVLAMFEQADYETEPEERRRLMTFFVAGGGFSGTELAGELADFARLLTSTEYPGIRPEECRVVVVHSGPTILPEFYGAANLERPVKAFPKLVDFAMRHSCGLGVELMLNTRVAAATPSEVVLSNGAHVPTRTIVSAVGTRPNPLLDQLPFERDDRGRVVVDACLRVPGYDGVWAAGDCAAAPHPKGGTCPPVALYACRLGRQLGENVARVVRGDPPRPSRVNVRMQGVSIGRRTAVGELGGIGLHGLLPWLFWRSVVLSVIPSWDRRVRTVSDWLVWPLVGRDVVQLGSARPDDYEVEHHVFQPGESMLERHRPVRYVHVILEGAAEVTGQAGTIASLNAGDHFNGRVLERHGGDSVRAVTVVRTISLRVEQARRLQQALAAAEPLVEQ
jgi:NADH:quinone reductase (non-electrogenic)